jgi:cbb3-type cytochrome oxidase maturation protein
MSVIVLLIVAGGLVAGGFLVAFVWAVRSGQFDDTFTPAVRVLLEAPAPGFQRAPKTLTNSEVAQRTAKKPSGQRRE